MINLNLIDSHFAHSISSCDKEPKLGKWKRDNLNDSDSIFITDSNFNQDTVNTCLRHKKKIYGWLLESPSVTSYAYKFALENHTLFEKIFTFVFTSTWMQNRAETILLKYGNIYHVARFY